MHSFPIRSIFPVAAVFLSILMLLTACGAPSESSLVGTAQSNIQLAQHDSSIEYDAEIGESPWPDEEAATLAIKEIIEQTVRSRYMNNLPALRHVHPKAHGCVLADFRVNETLQDEHQHGVFQANAHYKAWIRFSNTK